jgi:mutator family transposase
VTAHCRVHFMRNALAYVSKTQETVVAAAIRQAFIQPDRETAGQVWRHVADQLRPRSEKLGRLMDEAEHDVLAYMTFAAQHRTKLHSTNPLERLNKEVKRQPKSSACSRMRNPSCGSSAPFSWSTTTIGRRKIATCRSRASQSRPKRPPTSKPLQITPKAA